MNLKHDHSEDDDPRNSTSTYNTTNASSIRPQDTMPLSPYQNEIVMQQIRQGKTMDHLTDEIADLKETIKASVERQTDDANPVRETDATDFAEASPVPPVAYTTANLMEAPQNSYTAIQQSPMSPRPTKRKQRSASFSLGQDVAAEMGMSSMKPVEAKKQKKEGQLAITAPPTNP